MSGQFARRAAWFVIGDLVNRGAVFLLAPLWLRHMTLAEYGRFDVLRTISVSGAAVLGWGLTAAVTRWLATRDPRAAADGVVTTTALVRATVVASAIVAAALASGRVGAPVLGEVPLALAVLTAGLGAAAAFDLALLVYRGQARAVSSIGAATTLAGMGVGTAWLVAGGPSVTAVLAGFAVGAALQAAAGAWATSGERHGRFRAADAREGLAIGLPLLPHLFGQYALVYADRAFVLRLVGEAEAGVYGVNYLLASAVTVVCMALNKAMYPAVYAQLAVEGAAPSLAALGGLWMRLVALTAAGGLIAGTAALPWVAPSVPSDALWLPLSVVAGSALHGTYLLFVNVLFFHKRTAVVAGATLVAVTVNVALNVVAIPAWGALGAGVTTAASYVVLLALVARAAASSLPAGVPADMLAAARGDIALALVAAAGFVATDALTEAPRSAAAALWLVPVVYAAVRAWRARRTVPPTLEPE